MEGGCVAGNPAERIHSFANKDDVVESIAEGFGCHRFNVGYAYLESDVWWVPIIRLVDGNKKTKLRRKAETSGRRQ